MEKKTEAAAQAEAYCAAHGTFTQSAAWIDVKVGWRSETLVSKDERGRVRGMMLVLYKRLPLFGTFLYAPRGPICDLRDMAALSDLMGQAACMAVRERAFMLKIDPMIASDDAAAIANLEQLGFAAHPDRVGYENIQCRENYVLDLGGRSEEDIFAAFKPKWRYNIRLSQRKGVRCGFYREEALDDFMTLMRQTAARDGFAYRERGYFEGLLQAFNGQAVLCMCYLGDEPLSGALCIEYAGVMSYVYGCSADVHRNCMPNYLMQWTMIRRAIADGCRTYDFCGIPYWYDENHQNYGVYRFKQGFGGRVVTYAGEFDYCRRPLRCRLFDLARRLKRHIK